ncbi:hypothetical protein, partial [Nocardioides sp. SYSU DS0663]|uniref:hypothetical protein n=1 Tax=Nocardioides sp. SYSU DS0663 TaxID=3416445 RepID=UPI003F4B19EF
PAPAPAPAPVTWPTTPPTTPPTTRPTTPPDPRRRGPRLFWFTMALAALGIGVLGLLETGGVPVADAAYPALVATVCGAMLLLGSVWGRPGGLVAVGLLATLAMVATSAATEVEGSSRTEQPTVADDLRPTYRMGAGRLVLDLTRLTDLERLDDRVVTVEGGVGELEVVVPDDGLDVVARSEVGVGGTATFEDRRDGLGVETEAAHDGGGGAPTLLLEVRLGVGDIEITTEEGSNR